MFKKIRVWWHFSGSNMHRDFGQGVKNLWKWFPTIWKDRDWDHNFIYNLLAKKLEFQADFIGKSGIHIDAKRDAERIRLVVKLIKLQQESFYAMEYMDYQVTKEYFIPCDEEHYEWKQDTISETFVEYFAKYPLWHKRAIEYIMANQKRFTSKHTDDQLVAMVMGDLRQQKCNDRIFKIMSQDLQRWWD